MVKETLSLKNNNDFPVAFKVKTTSPRQYIVRPNAGRIEANSETEVQVVLQPMREDPPPDFKCKDKFLVQSIQLSEELEVLPLPDLWAHVEKNLKGQVSERRLRAVYLMPTEESLRRRDESLNLPNAGGASINSSLTPALENASILSDTEEGGAVKQDSLRLELEKANESIKMLRLENDRKSKELEDVKQNLRRQGDFSSERPDTRGAATSQLAKDSGLVIPVQMALVVAFLSFLIGYWFF